MPIGASFTFASPLTLAIAGALVIVAAAIAFFRRVRMPATAGGLLALGMISLALAAGGFTWLHPEPHQVAVMVDLSASTREARYRDPKWLDQRIAQLLGRTPYRVIYFASEDRSTRPEGERLPDLPGDHTVYQPPPASAVLLFSDARFDLPPAAPPTYIAVDPLLDQPADASIDRLELRGDSVAATITNRSADRREVRIATSGGTITRWIEQGTFTLNIPIRTRAQTVTVGLATDDAWPENDRLTLRIPPPPLTERWWVGANPPAGWKAILPAALPLDGGEYLAPSIIILNNVAAADLSATQQHRLAQYVRDLGGSLTILGGDRAFAAGGYTGTQLESLSPLSSVPPDPHLHWILLADSSGSMAEGETGSTRWDLVKDAMLRLVPHLPPEDPVTIGSFAQNIRWWSRGRSAKETASLPLPPADIQPSGPTNLESALSDIISRADSAYPKQLLILSDADADITQLDRLRAGLLDKKIRLFILDTYGKGRGRDALRQLAEATGGELVQEIDPQKWIAAAQKLLTAATPDQLNRAATQVRFNSDLASLPARSVALWNRTWLKPTATALAQTQTAEGAVSLAARWQFGSGQVLSMAFSPDAAELDTINRLIAQPPRDPRFKIAWQTGPHLRVSIDAIDNQTYLNRETLYLELLPDGSSAPQSQPIPQVAPGRYELSIPAPRQPVFAAVRRDGRVLDRTAVAGRYAPEFDAIGNDAAAMRDLALPSGGAVVPPTYQKPIAFNWPTRPIPLTSSLAAAGALFIALGLLWWRARP